MFGSAAFDQMPDSFRTDPAVWDGFIGRVWQGVLAPLALPRDATLVEIGPGSSAKIGHALALNDFCGTLYIVEAHRGALDLLTGKYATLLPDARLIPVNASFDEASTVLPRHADALIGNHVLDDFLLHAAARSDRTFDWAMRYSDVVAAETETAWAQLCAVQGRADALAATLADNLSGLIARLAPRHLVLSQYPSSTLAEHGMDALNTCARDVFDAVSRSLESCSIAHDCAVALAQIPHYNNPHIGLNVLNPRYWMARRWTA